MEKIEYTLAHDFNIATRNEDDSFRNICDVLEDVTKIYWNLEEHKKDLLKEVILGGV